MKTNLISIIPSKKIKRKIVNKLKFSKNLSKLFLNQINEFKLNDNRIEPTLYYNGKIAINLNFIPNEKILKEFLDTILFKFDLFIPAKIKPKFKRHIYLDNIYNINLFDNKDIIQNYEYIINIENQNSLNIFRYGFIESCLMLLNNTTDFIYNGKNKIKQEITKKEYEQLVNLSEHEAIGTLEKCNSDNIQMDFMIISTKIILSRVEKIKNINPSNKLLYKFLKNISNKPIIYSDKFILEQQHSVNSYFETTYDKILKELLKYDTITFDIFDTLVTRTILMPDDIFHIIEKKSKIVMPESFISIRKKAELEARSKLNKDVSLDEIYKYMKDLNVLSTKDVDKLKKLEIELELKHIIPRKDMIKIYNELLENNKNIDIISDMYLPKEVITKILDKCQVTNYRNLYISNEVNMRKDTGILWDEYFKNNKETTIHIGDNYNSDYIQVLKRNRKAIKILSSSEYLMNSDIFKEENIDIRNELAIIYNQLLFNSPFVKMKDIEDNLELYGEKLLAPIFYTFFDWFSKINTIKKILFVSREGYYLKPMYEKYCELFNKKKLENVYFLTSRRAATIASCKNIKDVLEVAKLEYNGTLDKFFINRFGVKISNYEKEMISLPDDYDKVKKIIIENKSIILENAAKEREEYLSYIKKVCKELKDHRYGIIDLGYSGTVQYYLSKLLDIKIDGYYFAITNKKRPSKIGCNIKGCFNESSDGIIDETCKIYQRSPYLESFLSAPEGQLIKFENNQPIFKDSTFNKNRKKYLDLIYNGIISGLEIYKEYNVKPFRTQTINSHYNFICDFIIKCKASLAKTLYLDDDFCGDGNEAINLNNIFH